ncbi:MAG: class I SAM-dependent methyltransferase [Acidimicrobiales bacterium]
MTPPGDDKRGAATRRWRRLVRARLAEMEVLDPDGAALGASFWDSRARRFATQTAGTARTDPLLRRVRRVARADSSLLDVGTGPGRFALALAPKVALVVAVDPSPVMLSLLRREARRAGIDNITTVEGRWEDVTTGQADVVLCSYVLPLIEDAAGFLAKLDASCRGHGFVYLSAMASDAVTEPFWRHFHGTVRRPGPTYLDAVGVLGDLGITADVEVVEVLVRSRYASLAAAVRTYRDSLLLPDTPDVRRELRHLLSAWLVGPPHALRPPLSTSPAAILHWEATGQPSLPR